MKTLRTATRAAAALACLGSAALADAAASRAVWERHVQAATAGDVDGVMADFTEESAIITTDGVISGTADIRRFFEELLGGLEPGALDTTVPNAEITHGDVLVANFTIGAIGPDVPRHGGHPRRQVSGADHGELSRRVTLTSPSTACADRSLPARDWTYVFLGHYVSAGEMQGGEGRARSCRQHRPVVSIRRWMTCVTTFLVPRGRRSRWSSTAATPARTAAPPTRS